MAVVFSLRAPTICFHPRLSFYQNLCLNLKPPKMARIGGVSSTATPNTERKLPILLFDIMDTVVRDPFYHDVSAFFGMTLKELIECKHPTAWMEFEKGIIDEMELASKFFKDGRPFDLEAISPRKLEQPNPQPCLKVAKAADVCVAHMVWGSMAGLKSCMKSGYSYVEGVEELLLDLKQNNYEMHAFTNYPIWYQLIEDKLKLSKYLSWTFCSCTNGKRKPDPEFYMEVLGHLRVDPSNCIFMDDRMKNVEAAIELGIRGIHFKNANALREELYLMGIDITTNGDHHKLI